MIGVFVEWVSGKNKQANPPGWVVMGNGCHEWVGAKDGYGYGVVKLSRRQQRISRVRYEREIGPIPDGMVLDHFACDNRSCCNPRHVRPVTSRENTLRSNKAPAAINLGKTHCPRGHQLVRVNANGRGCPKCNNEGRKYRKGGKLYGQPNPLLHPVEARPS